ncbi:MAG: hypothetical protein WDM85_19390 [Caulobacteraceae bacterium]
MNFVSAACALVALLTYRRRHRLCRSRPSRSRPTSIPAAGTRSPAPTTRCRLTVWPSTTDFSGWRGGAFSAVQTCHKGSPTGPKQNVSVQGHVLPSSGNAKIQLGMLGGLISREYWILDHAMTTTG